jgi:sterol 3beta-glucosyltransferase
VRVALLTFGSRGDAQPFVVLADELRRRGHDPVLGVSPNLVDFAARAGIEAALVGVDVEEFVHSKQGQHLLASGNARAIVTRMNQLLADFSEESDAAMRKLCDGADLVVSGFLTEDAAVCVAEAYGIPYASLHLCPMRGTRAFLHPAMTPRQFPGPVNIAAGRLFDAMWWKGRRADTARLRADLGLAPTKKSTPQRLAEAGAPELQAYSRRLVPDVLDWGPRRPFTGFLTPGRDLRVRLGDLGVDADLEAWLGAGPPPVYFGFGSMPCLDPEATLAMIRSVVAARGLRAIVGAGWSRFAHDHDEQVRIVGMVDHDALLPRCRAAVHHGGAGTTAAALFAGIPAVVCSVFADQPWWASRLERLGIGAQVRFAEVDANSLGAALDRVLTPKPGDRARHLGRLLRADAPAAPVVVDRLEGLAGKGR